VGKQYAVPSVPGDTFASDTSPSLSVSSSVRFAVDYDFLHEVYVHRYVPPHPK